MNTYRTISLKGNPRYEEAEAVGTLKPGMLGRITSSQTLAIHNVEGGSGETIIIAEDALAGKTINDALTAGERAPYILPKTGDEFNALLKAGEDVSVGDELISAGDGTFIKNGNEESATVVAKVFAVVREDLDLSGTDAVDTHVAARAL